MIPRFVRMAPVAALLLALAPATILFPCGARSAGAADLSSTPGIPAGVTPEQIESAKKMLETNPEARKALEEKMKQGGETAPAPRIDGERKEGETAKPEAAARTEPAPSLPPYDWKTSTYVGGLFLNRLKAQETVKLVHFGHEIFNPPPGASLVLENMPVSPGYVIGPGDEIVVKMWGRVEGTHRVTVDRDGKIYLPKFGSLYVAGKSFEEMKSYLRSKVATIAEVSSDVTMGQMKGIRISAVGEVRSPGWYNISSLHTALQALSLAGGIKDIGSLRGIEIKRGGKGIGEIDLYDYLLKGDTRSDVRLLQGDTIFVPVVGKLVAVAGEVRRPAIYELREEKSLLDLVRMAGGFAPTAFRRRVQVERLEGGFARIVLDADAEGLEKSSGGMELADGDIVRVFPIVLADQNAVTVEGNVVRPGKYELKPGMTVGSLFRDAKDFLPDTWFEYALLTRLTPPEMRKESIAVNLRQIVLEGKKEADVPLQAMDGLAVFPRSAFRDVPSVTVEGEVRKPGAVDLQKGARVADAVKLAGDPTKSASLARAEIVRIDEQRNFRTIYFDLGRALAGDEKENRVLEDEDKIVVHSVWEGKYRKTVTADGDVKIPGEYVLTDGMKLSDLVFKAGGLNESAYGREAELVRREIAPGGELVKTETVAVALERLLSGDPKSDVPLREYDLLVVRQIPDWSEKIVVSLAGEVRFPGQYTLRKGERLSSLITRAGGFTPDAYAKAAQFTRASTRESQQEAIDKLIADLELEIAQRGQEVLGSLDKEDLEANRELLNARRSLIEQLKKARAKGRVIIRLDDAEKIRGTNSDILLENGDRLEVPKKMNVVNVVGRVYNPTGVVYDPTNDALGYYLKLVGGPTESADPDHIFLVKANGSVVTRDNISGSFFVFGDRGLLSAKVEPGDSIVVPEKLIQTRLMKDVKDITQILYQIAVTAGVLIVAF